MTYDPAEDKIHAWRGAKRLEEYIRPIRLLTTETAVGDLDAITKGLELYGQHNPVLVADDETTVVGRSHIVEAARRLGWTHVAVRPVSVERSADDFDQMSLLDEAGDDETREALARDEEAMSIEAVNTLTAEANRQWAALPEFIQVEDTYKVMISCETDEERTALLDALGLKTLYIRKRGPISVRWPDYGRESLAAVRFESVDE